MTKRNFYAETAYLLGVVILAFGTSLMTTADLGLSMIVAPAYLLHLKLSKTFSFFSFGMAEYTLQAVLILLTILIVRKFKLSYLFSFFTAVLYGFLLDGALFLISLLPEVITTMISVRILFYTVGFIINTAAISLLFHTYISPEAYELIVKEISRKFHFDISKTKTVYDCLSLLLSVVLSFSFFGLWQFEGISIGTLLCTLLNGPFIGLFTRFFEKRFSFTDRFPFRKYFE